MNARQLVAVGLRLFAIWLCVSSLQFYGIISVLRRMATSWGNMSWIGPLIIAVCVTLAIILWFLSGPIARALTSGLAKAKTQETSLSASDIVAVGCVLMGLWWLKESIVPFVTLWLKAVAVAPDTGQSALAWLGSQGKVDAVMGVVQIGIGAFFVCRPYNIARWVLRHAPVIHDAANRPTESFDVLLRRATELGVRQVARPDIIAKLVELLASHPDHLRRLPELQELLQYKPNPHTRSAVAQTIVLIGPAAAQQAKSTAVSQLAVEETPEVVSDLAALIALADGHSAGASSEFPSSPAINEGA